MSLASQLNFKILSKLVIDNIAKDKLLLRALAYEKVKNEYDDAIGQAHDEFQQHVVTQELKEGSVDPENTPNYSSTLADASGGNLFTFKGFQRGQDPTAPIEQEFQRAHLKDEPLVAQRARLRRPALHSRGGARPHLRSAPRRELRARQPVHRRCLRGLRDRHLLRQFLARTRRLGRGARGARGVPRRGRVPAVAARGPDRHRARDLRHPARARGRGAHDLGQGLPLAQAARGARRHVADPRRELPDLSPVRDRARRGGGDRALALAPHEPDRALRPGIERRPHDHRDPRRAEAKGVLDRIDIFTGTLGKAMGGALGGFTTARKEVIELLRQRSRPYLFSNSLPPHVVAAGIKAFQMLSEVGELRSRLAENTAYFRHRMTQAGFEIKPGTHPICPVMLYDAPLAQTFAQRLLEEGIYAIGFFFPVVAKGQARIRTQMSAAHTREHVDRAIDAFTRIGRELGVLKA